MDTNSIASQKKGGPNAKTPGLQNYTMTRISSRHGMPRAEFSDFILL